jgi:phosphoribosylformylglycinamidine synthase
MRFLVSISRRDGLADPEGATTARALRDLGYDEVGDVHFGRTILVEVSGDDVDAARGRIDEMCRRLLANPVIEDFTIEALP